MLGFAPQNLKLDGRFHNLKVTVKNPPKLEVQARRGYLRPQHEAIQAEEAKQEIDEALFSQEEMHDLPSNCIRSFSSRRRRTRNSRCCATSIRGGCTSRKRKGATRTI